MTEYDSRTCQNKLQVGLSAGGILYRKDHAPTPVGALAFASERRNIAAKAHICIYRFMLEIFACRVRRGLRQN